MSELGKVTAPAKVRLISIGSTGPAARHAAALEPSWFDGLKLTRSLRSWTDVVRYPTAPGQLVNVIPEALRAYDLTDLTRLLPPGTVEVEAPLAVKSLAEPVNPQTPPASLAPASLRGLIRGRPIGRIPSSLVRQDQPCW